MTHPLRPRRAFTLVELLVVIAVIAVLIALLLPAVQRVRTAAYRASSGNNLKQIGLGFHAFHDANGYLANNGWHYSCDVRDDPAYNFRRYGWAYLLLPYVEQDGLYRTIKTNRLTPVKAFLCPGRGRDPVCDPPSTGQHGGMIDYASNNYLLPSPLTSTPVNGSDAKARRRFADITDGAATTILAGGKSLQTSYYRPARGANFDEPFFCGGGYMGASRGEPRRVGSDPARAPVLNADGTVAWRYTSATGVFRDAPGAPHQGWGGPFENGALFGMADGSVRTIRYGTDVAILLTHDRGEVVDSID